MTVTFQKERLEPAFWEAKRLFEDHWHEIGEMKDVLRLEPDIESYRKLDAADVLHILTARDDGKLVGYYAAYVKNNLHYKSVVFATDDLYFIHPDYRTSGVGIRLFIEAEKMLRAAKAQVSVIKEKLAHPHEALFKRLGYEPMERVYWKQLSGNPVASLAVDGGC